MLLNCGVGEDSWESLGLQGDPTSPFWRIWALGFLWKEWCWSWNSSTLATSCEELTHWKRLWCWEDWGQEEKGTTEDEIAGWHRWLDGRESQWTPGVGDGQGGLACCDSWGLKESDTTEQLIWSDLMQNFLKNLVYVWSAKNRFVVRTDKTTAWIPGSTFPYLCLSASSYKQRYQTVKIKYILFTVVQLPFYYHFAICFVLENN